MFPTFAIITGCVEKKLTSVLTNLLAPCTFVFLYLQTYREEVDGSAWSTLYSPPVYSKAGDAFLLLAPLRDGDFGNYAHIALIETNRTHIVHPLTFGHFEVEKILAWDEDNDLV